MTWDVFWDEDALSASFYRAVARDYFRRLSRGCTLDQTTDVLDFGCGPGFLARSLSRRVHKAVLFDPSVAMAQRARQNAHGLPNVAVVDTAEEALAFRYDYVLVNSVIQYMTTDEIRKWLGRWARSLKPTGAIIVSDVVPPGASAATEFAQSVWFSLLNRCVPSLFLQTLRLLRSNYRSVAREHPLTAISQANLFQLAADQGLHVTLFDDNLTYNRWRYAASIWISN